MAKSSDWQNQETIEQEAERCLEEGEATLSTITAYQVAKRLGCSANPTIYKYFSAWKDRKKAEAAGPPIQIPVEFERGLATLFDRFKADYLSSTTAMLGSAMRTLDDSANLKVAEEQRARADEKAFSTDIFAQWEREAQEHDAARETIARLENELAECRAEKLRLEGRLEQIMADRTDAAEATEEADRGDDDGYRPF